MIVYQDQLIVGGDFSEADGLPVNNIAAWNGIEWSDLGAGITGGNYPGVLALAIYNDTLVVGGQFMNAGGVSVNNIAFFDGNTRLWSSPDIGLYGGSNVGVAALETYNDNLVAAGIFTNAGTISVNNIASWDGSEWNAMGSGIQGDIDWHWVYDLAVWNNELIVGGHFNTAGGKPCNSIAKWTKGSQTCCEAWGLPGDANSDDFLDLLDILHIIEYVYNPPYGSPENPIGCNDLLDADGSGFVDLLDILTLIGNIYDNPPTATPVCP
jgi:hypothetical protein